MEALAKEMLDPETGVAIKKHKIFVTAINDAIAGEDQFSPVNFS